MSIHIGCCGWHYMHWPGDSYPANTISADFLKLYYEHFEGPNNFRFAIKESRYITHNKKIKDSGAPLFLSLGIMID